MRFGLLGTGPWADRTHGPALAAHPDADLVGVWGRRPEPTGALAQRLGTRPYADIDALFADCDAVAVALPPDVQAPLAVRAADAGCHLLLDKPVATTPEGARAVTEAVERNGVGCVVFFTLHFCAATAEWLRDLAPPGDASRPRPPDGGWQVGRADWLSPVFGGADSPYAASPWRREKGALWDVGPHALSVLLPLLGPVETVTAAPGGAGDTVHLVLRHTSGASSTCTLSHSVAPSAAGVTAEVRGTRGIAELPVRDEAPAVSFGRAVDALLTAVRTGQEHPCGARFAQSVTSVLHAAQEQLAGAGVPGRSGA
ncbi:Gfo/Idh/MocA family oxidoreductase [Streptomyces albus subsp. chlorinus]|uniref:Gfo/Idh/MocA family protein n=1 Tax=Streptomyces albus TaxID=1888 RepID=UPI00156E51CB|nr:Gfo/Idh/MocA family oxidoreductase [Streptomyces albus]NSC21341.1 Gfo/Idh/MocA family oxidoreductase [Streptomyces albus subsp. chlorinus]